ncbi:MAG: sensor histidine kinase [Rhodoluna sp.]
MPYRVHNKSSAVGRVNFLLGRVFSIATSLICLQQIINALPQANYLNQLWFGLSLGAIVISNLLILFLVWAQGDGTIGFQALTMSVLFSLTTWHLQLGNGNLPLGEHPWVWHGVGIAAIASIGAFSMGPSTLIVLSLPAIWFGIQISTIGNTEPWLHAFQDTAYTFLTTAVIVIFVHVLRWEANKVDVANQLANDAAVESARIDAIEHERARVDALVHDAVLTTLIVAANAKSAAEETSAAQMADAAIKKLSSDGEFANEENISIHSLFVALEAAATRQDAEIFVDIEGATDDQIPGAVASALTEATLQAVANSISHAGSEVKRGLFLRAKNHRIKIVIKDDGRGFRASRIPKDRLGVRLSIIARVEAVGGKVFIDSKPGHGTNIVIEWEQES